MYKCLALHIAAISLLLSIVLCPFHFNCSGDPVIPTGDLTPTPWVNATPTPYGGNLTPTPGGNRAPMADAGTDQTAALGQIVQLNGSNCCDPDGDTITFRWVQTGGPIVTLLNATKSTPTFEAKTAGTLIFEVTVSDGQANDVDTVQVIVQ